MTRPKNKRGLAAPMMTLPKQRRVLPNVPATAPWKVICARTRAAQAAIDASIADLKPTPGPVMVRGRARQRLTAADIERTLEDAAAIAREAGAPFERGGKLLTRR